MIGAFKNRTTKNASHVAAKPNRPPRKTPIGVSGDTSGAPRQCVAMNAPKALPAALPMLCHRGLAKTHCQSFAPAVFPQNARLVHVHQKPKNFRMNQPSCAPTPYRGL